MSRLLEQFGERGGTGHAKRLPLAMGQPQIARHWVLVKEQCAGLSLPSSIGSVPLKRLE